MLLHDNEIDKSQRCLKKKFGTKCFILDPLPKFNDWSYKENWILDGCYSAYLGTKWKIDFLLYLTTCVNFPLDLIYLIAMY